MIDADTGAPVAGVIVHADYWVGALFAHGGGGTVGGRTTRTDSDGRFVLHGRWIGPYIDGVDSKPELMAFDPDYGFARLQQDHYSPVDEQGHELFPPYRGIVLKLRRDESDLGRARTGAGLSRLYHYTKSPYGCEAAPDGWVLPPSIQDWF